MQLLRQKNLIITNNDVYLLAIINEKIIINDNYNGIIFLNNFLEEKKRIYIFDEIMIKQIYVSFSEKKILLDCYENNCLVIVDLNTYKFKKINLPVDDIMLFPIYWWQSEEEIILGTLKKKLLRISLEREIVTITNKDYIKKMYPEFFYLWMEYQDKPVHKFLPQENYILMIDQDNSELIIHNYIEKTKKIISLSLPKTHDIICQNGLLGFVSENELKVTKKDNDLLGASIKKRGPYIFTWAQFLFDPKPHIVAIKHNQSVYRKNIIGKYEVVNEF